MTEPNPSGFTPLDMRVLVRLDKAEEKVGSVILPDSVVEQKKWAQTKATFIEAGENAFREWAASTVPGSGSRVLIAQYAGKTHKGRDGQDYVICNDEDILALVEE